MNLRPISFKMWRLEARFPRLKFQPGFPKPGTDGAKWSSCYEFRSPIKPGRKDVHLLLDRLGGMLNAIAEVEGRLEEKYGITEHFSEIKIVRPLDPYNNASTASFPHSIWYHFGAPGEYDLFFGPHIRSIHGHETGHLLFAISVDGNRRYKASFPEGADIPLYFQTGLIDDGNLSPARYLSGIDFRSFPMVLGRLDSMEQSKLDSLNKFAFFLEELIANRVSEKIVGKEADKMRIANQFPRIQKRYFSSEGNWGTDRPWRALFFLVMADIHGLQNEATGLERWLADHDFPYSAGIPVKDLREQMARFYHAIDIVSQK